MPDLAPGREAVAPACPRCTDPMQVAHLHAPSGGAVEVDLCPGCRLVWFDDRESLQLSGLGWATAASTRTGAGIVLGVPVASLWAWIGSRVMAWVYERLCGDAGLQSWVYRQLRGEFGARRI